MQTAILSNNNHINEFLDELKSFQTSESLCKTKCQKPQIHHAQQAIIRSDFHSKTVREDSSGESGGKEIIPNGICDGRIKVENPTKWPYSSHCLLRMKFTSQEYYSGSATIIGPNLAITAAHNLYNLDNKEEIKLENLMLFPGANETVFPFRSKIVKYFYPKQYVLSNGKKEDFGLLILEKDIGLETGYYGLCCMDEEMVRKVKINITGYPSDKVINKPFCHEMWGMDGEVYEVDQDLISYRIDTYGGQSGSGIVWKDTQDENIKDPQDESTKDSQYYVIGVHVIGDSMANKGTYMTKKRIAQIQGWLESYFTELELSDINALTLGNGGCGEEEENEDGKKKDLASAKPKIVNHEHIELQFNENVTDEMIEKLASRIINTNQLKVVKLDFEDSDINSKALIQIIEALKHQQNLTTLSLNLKSTDMKDKVFILMAEALRNQQNLNVLELNLVSTDIGDNLLAQIAESIQNLQNLSKLSLNLNCCENIKDEGIKALSKTLIDKKNIVEFFLHCGETNATNIYMVEIVNILKKNLNILAAEVDLDDFSDMDDGPIIRLGNSSDDDNSKSLSLRLNYSRYVPKANQKLKAIMKFAENLKEDKDNMTKVDFDLEDLSKIDDESVYLLAAVVNDFQNITDFKLTLRDSKINDESIIQIMHILKDKQNLKTFWVDLTYANISGKCVIPMANMLKNKENLTEFYLSIGGAKALSDESITQVAQALKQNQQMEKFELYVYNNIGVADASIMELADSIKNKSNLKIIGIDLRLTNVNDGSVLKLGEALKENQNLDKCSIYLEPPITHAGAKQLKKLIKAKTVSIRYGFMDL